MVEVSPNKGEIQIRSGWIFFTLFAVILFSVLFYFVPNTGWYWYALGGGVVLAFLIDFFAFAAPPIVLILLALLIGVIVGVKTWM